MRLLTSNAGPLCPCQIHTNALTPKKTSGDRAKGGKVSFDCWWGEWGRGGGLGGGVCKDKLNLGSSHEKWIETQTRRICFSSLELLTGMPSNIHFGTGRGCSKYFDMMFIRCSDSYYANHVYHCRILV